MEYIEGAAHRCVRQPASVARVCALLQNVWAAVHYLHQHQVIHRDMKPAEYPCSDHGEPKLLDFGIAKMLDSTADSTVTAMRILTPDYASPEQISGGVMGTATDIYALGAVLYKLLTGTSPHQIDGKTPEAMVLAATRGEIRPPRKIAPFLNRDLELILPEGFEERPARALFDGRAAIRRSGKLPRIASNSGTERRCLVPYSKAGTKALAAVHGGDSRGCRPVHRSPRSEPTGRGRPAEV